MISWIGIAIAGILNGTFAVPMKTARGWKFNHIWGTFSVLAMIVIPWVAVFLAVPGWKSTLASIPRGGLTGLIALGLIWGVASLLYGLAIDLLGIGLGFSIQLGLSIVIGALIPFAMIRGFAVRTSADVLFLAGLVAMVLGVIVCARAGRGSQPASGCSKKFRLGIIVAIFGGIGSPLLNIGIGYGISLLPRAEQSGGMAQWVAWAVFLSAAAVSQAAICFYRIAAAREWGLFRGARAYNTSLVLGMSIVWAASIFLYGIGAASLGQLGTSVGWPVFIGIIVIASNAWGIVLGEWKQRPRRDLHVMLAGSAVLVTAVFVIAQARSGW